jgi:nitronate monooxygenase
MALAQHIRDRLTLPAFCAPMFLCSSPELAAECRKAGIVGSLTASHCRDLEELESHLAFVSESAARFAEEQPERAIGPFAVNVPPTKDPADFRVWLEACERHGADIIVTSVGNPTAVAPVVRDMGFQHYHDVTNIRFAEKAAAAGVDGMIAIGAGGGGHAGTISHLAFIPKIREMFGGTVVMAGAVTTGGAIRAAEMLGADLAYLGTRFIATKESAAPDPYKAMLVEGGIDDVIYTRAVNGMPASWLKASLRETGLDPDNLFIPEGRSTEHLPADKTPWRDIWSGGQGIGLIDAIPTAAQLVAQLQREYVEACAVPDMAEAATAALAGVT